jgi:hypothetical protein
MSMESCGFFPVHYSLIVLSLDARANESIVKETNNNNNNNNDDNDNNNCMYM